jgi:uncharacterized protein (DUF885 family)
MLSVLFGLLVASMTAHPVQPAQAAGSVDINKLAGEYWQGYLRAHPRAATSLGDRRYDALLEDQTPAGIARERERLTSVLDRAKAIDERALTHADRLNRSALIEEVSGQLAVLSCEIEKWEVDPLGGPQVEFFNLPDYTPIRTPKEATDFVARCRAIGPYVDAAIANLRDGKAHGRVASAAAVRKALEQLAALDARPPAEWSLLAPAQGDHADWPAGARDSFRADLTRAVTEVVKPAMDRYRDFLQADILPVARSEDRAGLSVLPDGEECYKRLIRVHTSLEKSPKELHELGLAEVARVRRELSELGGRVLGTTDVAEIQKRLRTDPAMHFRTGEEVEAKAREALARAKAAIPNYFGTLPKADCQVKVMGMHEAPQSTIAYYREPAADGSRPGYYMINTYKPETRPRYEAEALAFHEAIPGHHLQIAIASELTGLPEFRKHQGVTAYVEGWGLYSERLADDMHLYSSDTDRIGMLSFDAWRACRLVVDTGMHALGWSRQQAIDYMVQNTVLAENNIENEVDRYLAWPGQALAYKVGQIEILRLRDEGRKRLGDRFDIKAFHDVVLKNGAVALPILEREVEEYYASVEKATRGR